MNEKCKRCPDWGRALEIEALQFEIDELNKQVCHLAELNKRQKTLISLSKKLIKDYRHDYSFETKYNELEKQLEAQDDLKKQITGFMVKMSSQDNRGTAFPYYYTIVEDKAKYTTDDLGECLYDTEGELLDIKELIEENEIEFEFDDKEFALFNVGSSCEPTEVEKFLDESFLDGYTRVTEDGFDSEFTGVFLTKDDAEQFLENSQNHFFEGNARTYVKHFSAWSRKTETMEFFENIFKYFNVKKPPEMYYENKAKQEER